MATLREQAREAATLHCKLPGNFTIGEVADAASDVWEPHVRYMVDALRNAKDRLEYFGKTTYEIDAVLATWDKANG